jgi:uncharacterized RDD family membrane protein YckC
VSAPEKLTIETPEQVALDFTLASIGSRFLALAIDTAIQVAAAIVVVLITAGVTIGAALTWSALEAWTAAVMLLAFFVLYYGYFAVFEAMWSGQTPGKRVVGLRVLGVSGRPISTFEAILRNVVRIADQLPGIYAIGILVAFVTERHQRLGDLAAGTVVVHEQPLAQQPGTAVPRPVRMRYGAGRLTPDEVAVIETFLRRRPELTYYGRLRASRKIAMHVKKRLDLAAIPDEEAFLEDVAAEFRETGRYR